MEIKHTIEILTKDIQDIEKLVRNLNNSPIPSRIELDLALSKLRHVYELLSMIRTDAKHETVSAGMNEEMTEPIVEQVAKEPVAVEPAREEPVVEVAIKEEPAAVVEETVQAEPVQEETVQAEPVQAEPVQAEIPLREPEILAEKFSNDPSINENIASGTPKADLSSKITGQPIDNIGRNIGINDRFLIIRELFDGDNDSYTHLINQLDSSTGSDEALGILEAKFPKQKNHEGYRLLTQLARRKFILG